MLTIAMILLVLSTLLTIGLVYWYFTSQMKRSEGFQDGGKMPLVEQANLLQILGTIKRLGGQLMNVSMWTERMALAKMSPTELARKHLNSNSKE